MRSLFGFSALICIFHVSVRLRQFDSGQKALLKLLL